MNEAITFANADLEIQSTEALVPLRDNFMKFGDLFFEMCCEKINDGYFASFEIHPVGIEMPTAAQLIGAFCDSIKQLENSNRQLWDRADSRVIDLGYIGANHCQTFHDFVSHETLLSMTELKIDLAITVYPENILYPESHG